MVKKKKATEKVLERTAKMREREGCNKIYIKKYINEEGKKIKEVYVGVDEKNNAKKEGKKYWRMSFERKSEEMIHKGKRVREHKIERNSKNEGLNKIYANIDEVLHRNIALQNY